MCTLLLLWHFLLAAGLSVPVEVVRPVTFKKQTLAMGREYLVSSLAFSPDGKTIAIGGGQEDFPSEVRLYSVDNRQLLATLKGHNKRVNCLVFSSNGRLLVSGGNDNQCIVWDVRTNARIGALEGHSEAVLNTVISSDGKFAFTTSCDNTCVMWDLADFKRIRTLTRQERMRGLAHSPRTHLLTVGAGNSISIFDTQTKLEVARFKAHESDVGPLLFSSDGSRLVSAGNDGDVKFWNLDGWAEEGQFPKCDNRPLCLAISPRGHMLVVGFWSGEATFYNTSKEAKSLVLSHELITRLSVWIHKLPVTAMALGPDGKTLATGSIDTTVNIWTDLPVLGGSEKGH